MWLDKFGFIFEKFGFDIKKINVRSWVLNSVMVENIFDIVRHEND